MIIQGDMSQCDKYKANGITAYEKSGFYDVWFRLKGVEGVEHHAFTREDCIRHPLLKNTEDIRRRTRNRIIILDIYIIYMYIMIWG